MFTRVILALSFLCIVNAAPKPISSAAPCSSAPSPTAIATVNIGKDEFLYESLVGKGTVASDARDQFGDTLGGWGSAIAADLNSWKQKKDGSYEGTVYATPDRGWNTNGTTDFQARIHRFNVTFTPYYGSTPVSGNQLVWNYVDSLLLYDNRGLPTTGLDAAFIIPHTNKFPDLPAGQAQDGTLKLAMDCEGLVLDGNGGFYISDEYGPYIYHFNKNGQLTDAIVPPEAFIPMRNGTASFSADSPPIFNPNAHPIPANPITGRQNNQGFEGFTMSEDGKSLFALLQSATIQDTGSPISATRRNTRLLQWNINKGKWVGEWVVQLPTYDDAGATKVAAQSEMHFLDNNRFLVLARDSDIVDISKATNIIGTKFDNGANPIAPAGVLDTTITPAAYYPFLDFNLNAQLNKFGLINGGPLNGPGLLNEKWESIAVLPTFRKSDEFFIISANDNDFVTQNGFINFGETTYKDPSGFNFDTQSLVFLVEFDDSEKHDV